MRLDGIPDTLPPVTETADRPRPRATDPAPVAGRRRVSPMLRDEEEMPNDGDQDNHALDDLA